MRDDFSKTMAYVCEHPADTATARRISGDVLVATADDAAALLGFDDVVLIARGDGVDKLHQLGIVKNGRVLDLGKNGSLSAFLEGGNNPRQEIETRAVDAFWAEERPFAEWTFPEVVQGVSSGIHFLDDNLRWTDAGELVIVAGPYGSGKSSVTRLLAMSWADHVGRRTGKSASICGWEDRGEIVAREVERYALGGDVLQPDASQWRRLQDMRSRVRWTQRLEGEERLLAWYAAMVEHRATRHNVGFFIFDPWNEHDAQKDIRQTETDYVRDMMKEFQAMARRLQIIIVIVTHVSAKLYDEKGGIRPFRIAHAAGCHDSETEVLTDRGWLPHAEVTLSDNVACFDLATEAVTYQKPTHLHRYEYDGEMHKYQGFGLDLFVTPNHRMVVKHKPNRDRRKSGTALNVGRPFKPGRNDWQFVESQDVAPWDVQIPRCGNPVDGGRSPQTILGYPAKEFCQIVGWYIAEGTYRFSTGTGGLHISQASHKMHQITDVLDRAGVSYAVIEGGPGGKGGTLPIHNAYIHARKNRELVDFIKAECGKYSYGVKVPELIFGLSSELKEAFLLAYLAGDGHLRDGVNWRATTTSKELADGIHRLAIELGYPASVRTRMGASENQRQQWMINFLEQGKKAAYINIGRPLEKTKMPNRIIKHYKGSVWCLTVPTGAYIVRRNGNSCVTGNSSAFGAKASRGICVLRTTDLREFSDSGAGDHTVLYFDKNKVEEVMGTRGPVACLFNPMRMQLHYDAGATMQVKTIWR